MIKHISKGIIFSLTLMILSACGGGGGGGGAPAPGPADRIKISLGSLPGGRYIIGAEFTLTLPANVTPNLDNFGQVTTDTVTLTGTFARSSSSTKAAVSPFVEYVPAVGATPATLHVIIANSTEPGVTTAGEVATIILKTSNGATLNAASFGVKDVIVEDSNGLPINGMTATVSL